MNELIVKEESIESMIYEIRGRQVMLDSDLAKLYQCKNGTKEINQAVRNNPDKFPERFSWKLSDLECQNFLVKNFDQKIETRGGKYKDPRVFTEQGVAMLATILKSKTATDVSIKIMDTFVLMRKYISSNLIRVKDMEDMIIRHDNEIKGLQSAFKKLEEKKVSNEIYFEGQIYDAYSKILDILSIAKNEITIIDAYADKSVLDIISKLNVKVILICKNNGLIKKIDVDKYNKQYSNLTVIYDNTFHDRYFIIDNSEVYHCVASINHAGSKTFSINYLTDQLAKKLLIDKVNELIKG